MSVFEEVFFSGTHGGEALSLAAARAVLDTIADTPVLASIEQLGTRLLTGWQERIADHGVGHLVRASGEPHRPVVTFPGDTDQIRRSWVHQCFAQHGILFNGSTPVCARHTDDDITLGIAAFDQRPRDARERGRTWPRCWSAPRCDRCRDRGEHAG